MLPSRIPMLERFGTCSTIIQYYDAAHKSFLTLSQLSRGSREMMDLNFEAILNAMLETTILLKFSDESKNMMSFPWSLFRFTMEFDSKNGIKRLIEFIDNLNNEIGFYFNKHYMHNRLWILKIVVHIDIIKDLNPYTELLKNTEVIRSITNKSKAKINIKLYYLINDKYNFKLFIFSF